MCIDRISENFLILNNLEESGEEHSENTALEFKFFAGRSAVYKSRSCLNRIHIMQITTHNVMATYTQT